MKISALVASISIGGTFLIAGCSSNAQDAVNDLGTGLEKATEQQQPGGEHSNDETPSPSQNENVDEDVVDEDVVDEDVVDEAPASASYPDASLVEVDGGYLVPDRIGEFVLVTKEMWLEFGMYCSGFGPPRFYDADQYDPARVHVYYTNNWDYALAQTACARTADYMLEVWISDHLSEQAAANAINEGAAQSEAEESVRPGAHEDGPDGSYCYNAARPMCRVQAGQHVLLAFPYAPETLFDSRENATKMTAEYVVQLKENLGY